MEFSRFYQSQPLFRDVDAFLAEQGFTLFKLRRKSWVRANCLKRPQISAGQMVAADALYLRDPFLAGWDSLEPNPVHHLEALVLVSALYDLNDFALEIASDKRFSPQLETGRITEWIHQRGSRLDYRSNGSGRLASWIRIAREIRKGKTGWGNLYEWSRRRSWGRADSNKDFYTRTN